MLAVVVLVSACTSSGSSGSTGAPTGSTGAGGTDTTPVPSSTSASSETSTSASPSVGSSTPATTGASKGNLYVSLGDSYAAGFQATGKGGQGRTTTNGFAYQTVTKAKAKGYDLKLVNFGCAGATTTSIISDPGCKANLLGPGAASYSETQAAAAEAYLRSHQGQVALVTVSIGGNDVTACAADPDTVACLTKALGTVRTNLTKLMTGLRAAAGPSTQIVGITYPDVLLGNALSSNAKIKQLAQLSVVAFKSLINPTLQAVYTGAGAKFVDVTAATGAYGSLTTTTTVAPYGKIPVPVAKICQLTYYCQYQDIHPRTNGYAIIAGLVVGTLPKR